MNIKFAILGFLSWQPFTGYDIKKLFMESTFIYWSGNNNQIYKTLVQLHREGLVTNELQYQENKPNRKMYSITKKGLAELREWIQTSPELPQLRNTFLIQLAWADQLKQDELFALLDKYEYEVKMQFLMTKERKRRNKINPSRTKRETCLWNMISDNCIAFYENELIWINKLRNEISKK